MTLKPLGSKQDWMSIFRNKHLSQGCKGLPSFQEMVDFTMQHWKQIEITDEDVAELAARKQCHIGTSPFCRIVAASNASYPAISSYPLIDPFAGVTQCFPPGHCCIETPGTLRDLVKLVLSSMSAPLQYLDLAELLQCSKDSPLKTSSMFALVLVNMSTLWTFNTCWRLCINKIKKHFLAEATCRSIRCFFDCALLYSQEGAKIGQIV